MVATEASGLGAVVHLLLRVHMIEVVLGPVGERRRRVMMVHGESGTEAGPIWYKESEGTKVVEKSVWEGRTAFSSTGMSYLGGRSKPYRCCWGVWGV